MPINISPYPGGSSYAGLLQRARTSGNSNHVEIYPEERKETELLFPWEIPGTRDFYPIIAMFWGRRGQGKTLSMTTVGAMMLQRYIKAGIKSSAFNPGGHKICSNYHVNFADFHNPMLVDMLVDFPPWAHDMICMIDEILAFFPNRRSLARGNLNFATFLQQIRKRSIELLFTTQFPQNMDRQMVEQIDLFIRPELFNNGNSVRLIIHDWWGQFTGNMIAKKWPPISEPPDWIVPVHGIKSVYGAYPTGEVVAPMWSSNREDIITDQWSTAELDANSVDLPPTANGDVSLSEFIIPPQEVVTKKAATLEDLVNRHGDQFYTDEIMDEAKLIGGVRNTAELNRMLAMQGYTIVRSGHKYLAVREGGGE